MKNLFVTSKSEHIVRFTKFIASLSLALAAVVSAPAQDLMPEAMPTRLEAERVVKEVKALSTADAINAITKAVAPSTATLFGENVVKTALQYIGARYRSGMQGPYAFDCSGFTSFIYRSHNVPILRDSRSQFTQGTPIARTSDLKKGDLVFFGGRSGSSRVGHVGIVTNVDPETGSFDFIHSSSSSGVKISSSKEAYYSRRYVGARRIVE